MVATTILAKVDGQRLQKAVEGLVSGAYTISVTEQGEQEIRGFVANGDGKDYGIVLTEEQTVWSWPDAMYSKRIGKHAVALALYVIRTPQSETEPREEARPVNLKLTKTRPGWVACA